MNQEEEKILTQMKRIKGMNGILYWYSGDVL